MGQTFTAGLTGVLDTVQVGICKINAPGDLVVTIEGTYTDALANPPAQVPDDSNVLATQSVPAGSINAPCSFLGDSNTVTIPFDHPASIQAGTTYTLVLSTPDSSGNDGYSLGLTDDTYSGGQFCSFNSAWDCPSPGEPFFSDTPFATFVSAAPPAPAQVGLSPSSLSFGNQPLGSTSSAHTVTITNTASSGAQSLAIGALTRSGTNAGDFTLGNDTCSNTSVAPGGYCTVDVSFAPTAIGSRSASLSVPSNAASSPDQVALTGTGTTQADVALSMSGPTSVKKGTQVSYVLTVSNAGPSTAHNVVMTNPVPAGSTVVGVSTSKGTCAHRTGGASKGTISCSLGDLASSGSAGSVVSVKITAKIGGTITDIASAYSTANSAGPATFDPDTSNNWKSLSATVTK